MSLHKLQHVIRKDRHISSNYVYSTILLYVQIYKFTHLYIKACQMSFVAIFYILISTAQTNVCHNIHKNSSQFLKSLQAGNPILPKKSGETAKNQMK